MTTINELVKRIHVHRGVILPDTKTYLDYHFRYACRLLECYELNPVQHSDKIEQIMYNAINRDANVTMNHYWRSNKPLRWHTPSVELIDTIMRDDMSFKAPYDLTQ